ncbi:hypothetical protein QYM36_011327 [Artemia franciscana]|uniref:Uncharacterized protein n=1 Tax=Artemia franciscana TaxID=6661 RepID=A0AA88HIF4_ARTSF|nr:hypothetical protein QYM36_011327 [Artemia franciscana]
MDGVDKRYIELELGSCRIAPQVDSSSCGLFVVKYAQDYGNGITYSGSAQSVDLPSPSKYKRSKGRSTVSNQKVIDLYNDDTEMANMKTVELMNKYRNELAVQKYEFRVYSWNVRSVKRESTRLVKAMEMNRYQADVLCLSETRLNGVYVETIPVRDSNNSYLFLNSGEHDGSGDHGVGLMIGRHVQKALLAWDPVNLRIARP